MSSEREMMRVQDSWGNALLPKSPPSPPTQSRFSFFLDSPLQTFVINIRTKEERSQDASIDIPDWVILLSKEHASNLSFPVQQPVVAVYSLAELICTVLSPSVRSHPEILSRKLTRGVGASWEICFYFHLLFSVAAWEEEVKIPVSPRNRDSQHIQSPCQSGRAH